MNSITKRWVRGSLLFTIAVVLVAEALFLYFTISGYYSDASAAIRDQLTTTRSQLSLFKGASSEEKALRLVSAVEQFEKKDQFEMMLINAAGQVVLTSSGVLPASGNISPDVATVLASGSREAVEYNGKNENGEKVMAVTERIPYVSGDIVAIRIVTSLTLVDRAIVNVVLASAVFFVVILLASVISGVYFIRSIVRPLQKVEATASRIAQGDLDTRIENNSNDEIGKLCQTINHMAEELSHTEDVKNEFISSVSHELRTPLTSIKGWTETVGNFRDPDDPNFQRGVAIINSEADRLYGMVEELLDFSRMQKNMKLDAELLDLAAEVEEAVILATQRAASLSVALSYDMPEVPVAVMADANRVRQVLVNILDNALKYSPPHGTIYVDISRTGTDAYVTVADEGPGISPEDLEKVRTKFYKGKNAVRGSGIGLAVVDTIMQAHGGELLLASELGAGTQVGLRFPLYMRPPEEPGMPGDLTGALPQPAWSAAADGTVSYDAPETPQPPETPVAGWPAGQAGELPVQPAGQTLEMWAQPPEAAPQVNAEQPPPAARPKKPRRNRRAKQKTPPAAADASQPPAERLPE